MAEESKHECDLPEFLAKGMKLSCYGCGVIWEQVGADEGGYYWESIGNIEEEVG